MWRKRASAVAWGVLLAAAYGVIGNQSNEVFDEWTGGGLRQLLRGSAEQRQIASAPKSGDVYGYDTSWDSSPAKLNYDYGSGQGSNEPKYNYGWDG
jgi:hypothetical protein